MPRKIVPDFKAPEDFDEWIETHDTSKYEFVDAPEVKLRPRKKPITLKVYPAVLYEVKHIAERRKMPYQTLINQWLIEKIAEDKALKR